jgi:hypothetical protein
VVGRAVRQTGSRPLLLAEVLEHWDMLLDTCITRWSLEQGCGRAELSAQVRGAYLDAERAYCSGGGGGSGGGVAGAAAGSGCGTAVAALQAFSGGAVYVASCRPHVLGQQLLAASGLAARRGGVAVVEAASLAGAVGRVVGLQGGRGGTVHVVVGGLGRAKLLLRELAEEAGGGGGGGAQLQVQVHLAEWACTAPSLRARALCQEGLGLLAEGGLARLLGVEHVRAVMDGVAWR